MSGGRRISRSTASGGDISSDRQAAKNVVRAAAPESTQEGSRSREAKIMARPEIPGVPALSGGPNRAV